ncbi:hypothetical protein RDI58_007672 [Solanum bulbocastanum]|uniref:YDG domain-containing protein n=1 Tax=Solanum bulbocastanum TaxID=147425 RepID=A0AAN8TVL9_SOLBU
MLGKKKLHQLVHTKSPSTFKRLVVDATRNFPQNCGSFVCQNNGTREINPEFPSTTKPVRVETTRNFPENCGPFVHENNETREINPEFPSNTKPVRVKTRRNFPENCGLFVNENNRTRKMYPEFPSNTKRVKVDSRRSFPENCGPCVPQKRNGSDTQCSVDAESISCSEDMAEPSNFEATGARPKEAGGSSHLNTNRNQPLKLKEENLMYDESTQQHEVLISQALQKPSTDTRNTCDWFIKDEPIESGPELPAIVSQENLIKARNEPSNETSQRVHHEEVSYDESRSWVDDDDISILTCSEWNSLRSGLKAQSTDGKKGGKEGEIIHNCSDILEDAVDFMPLPDIIRPEQRDEQNNGHYFFYKDWDQYESVVMKKQMDLGVPQQDLRNSAVMCGVSGHGLSTEYEHIHKVKEVRETLKLFDNVYTKLLQEDKAEKHEGRSKRNTHIEAAMTLKNQKKWVNCEWTFGHVPGVEIGDQFRFCPELVTIGLHHQFMNGINYVNIGRKYVATSIVDSDRYDNEAISSETFIYVGQGGNPKVSVNARVEDQKYLLIQKYLALKNSMDMRCPVRVICGRQRVNGEKSDMRYIYDGLYTMT